ncbi:hypothetical protein L4C37_21375 [Vibrio kagoshimensis]|uniref:hypothetical protein n=1 Tax=Vibrio kagoshimensis TaxID=2910244 RepID=UPI003D1C16FE
MYGNVKLEGNQVYSVSKPLPIHVDKIEYMYVKKHDSTEKFIKAAAIGSVVSALLFVLHPLLILVVFPIVFAVSFLQTKKYELRVFVTHPSGFGSKESILHSSSFRDEYDTLIEQVKAINQKT